MTRLCLPSDTCCSSAELSRTHWSSPPLLAGEPWRTRSPGTPMAADTATQMFGLQVLWAQLLLLQRPQSTGSSKVPRWHLRAAQPHLRMGPRRPSVVLVRHLQQCSTHLRHGPVTAMPCGLPGQHPSSPAALCLYKSRWNTPTNRLASQTHPLCALWGTAPRMLPFLQQSVQMQPAGKSCFVTTSQPGPELPFV